MHNLKKRSILFIVFFAIFAFYSIFRLPFRFPPRQPLVSSSYSFGFNNQAGIAAVGLLLIAATIFQLRSASAGERLRFSADEPSNVSYRLLGLSLLIYLLFTSAIYLWARSETWYGMDWETSHFLWRARLTETYGLKPYRDYQYEYGPLLAYLPIGTQKVLSLFGASDDFSYYVVHWLLDAAGLCGIAFILNHLVIPQRRRNVIFGLLAAAAFLPYMGLSGVVLRFIAPLFGLTLIYRLANVQARPALLFVGTLIAAALNLGLSAEIGLSFLLAAGIYGLLLLPKSTGVVILGATAAAVCLSFLLLPRVYYVSLFHFSQGANNLPLLPTSPHLVLYLAAMLWFVPQWLATGLRTVQTHAALLAAACLCILLMPGALGRCDPPHIVTYSLTLAVLAMASLANGPKALFSFASFAYVAVFVVAFQLINVWVFHVTPVSVIQGLFKRPPAPPDFRPLEQYETLASPFGTSGSGKALQNWLWSHRKVAPEYYLGGMGIYTEAQIEDRLKDLRRFRYAISDAGLRSLAGNTDTCADAQRYIRKALLNFRKLTCEHQAIDPNVVIAQFLARRYRIIQQQGEYVVWERSE